MLQDITEKLRGPDRTKTKPSRLEKLGRFLDNAIFQVSPSLGAKRKSSRLRMELIEKQTTSLGHPSMEPNATRDTRWIGNREEVDDQLEANLVDVQYRARELYQTNPHAHGAVEGRVTHEIGVGLHCRPQVKVSGPITEEKAEEINGILKDVCNRWSNHGVDRRRRASLAAMQRLVERTYAIYGEAFVVFREAPYRGSIGLTCEEIHPMRVETPPDKYSDANVRMGIRYHSKTDQIIGYYVRVKGNRFSRYNPEYQFIRRYNQAGQEQVVHVFESMLPEQSRGIPWLCAAFAFLKDLDDFHEAELIGKQIEACFGLIFKGGGASASPSTIAAGNASGDTDTAGNRLEDIFPGMIHYADAEEEVTKIDPNRPGSTFAPFIEASLRTVASALNYPYELLAKNFFRTTYSSGRLAMLDGQLGFRIRRQPIIEQFLSPLWRRVVASAFFHGHLIGVVDQSIYLAEPHLFDRHSWGGSSFGAIDPNKEVSAHADAIESNQETLAEVHAERNGDWSDVLKQRDIEIRKELELRLDREKYEKDTRTRLGIEIEDPNAATVPGSDSGKNPSNGSGTAGKDKKQGSK